MPRGDAAGVRTAALDFPAGHGAESRAVRARFADLVPRRRGAERPSRHNRRRRGERRRPWQRAAKQEWWTRGKAAAADVADPVKKTDDGDIGAVILSLIVLVVCIGACAGDPDKARANAEAQ